MRKYVSLILYGLASQMEWYWCFWPQRSSRSDSTPFLLLLSQCSSFYGGVLCSVADGCYPVGVGQLTVAHLMLLMGLHTRVDGPWP